MLFPSHVLRSHQIVTRLLRHSQRSEPCSCQHVITARPFSRSSIVGASGRANGGAMVTKFISQKREAKFFKKMIGGKGKSGRKNFDYNLRSSEQFNEFGFLGKGDGKHKKPRVMSGRVRRRVEVLNNLFVEQITSLLATGEVSPEFIGLGIQISHVKTKTDFSGINVYWHGTGTENDEKIEELLKRTGGHLRHVLSQLKVIGIVPPIQFFKDTTFSKLQEVEYLLSKCDLETDFSSPNDDNVTNGSEQETRNEEADGVLEETTETSEMKMRQDILGVRHDFIMSEIMKAMQRQRERKLAKEKHIQQIRSISDEPEPDFDEVPDDCSNLSDGIGNGTTLSSAVLEVEDHRKRQHEFLQYLKTRKAERDKELKRLSTDASDKEFYESEKSAKWRSMLEDRLDEIDEDESDDDSDADDTFNEDEYYENQRQHFKDI